MIRYKIRDLRERKKLSQMELANASGVSRSIISSLESGREVTTTTDTLSRLANALGVSVSGIFFEDESNKLDE